MHPVLDFGKFLFSKCTWIHREEISSIYGYVSKQTCFPFLKHVYTTWNWCIKLWLEEEACLFRNLAIYTQYFISVNFENKNLPKSRTGFILQIHQFVEADEKSMSFYTISRWLVAITFSSLRCNTQSYKIQDHWKIIWCTQYGAIALFGIFYFV